MSKSGRETARSKAVRSDATRTKAAEIRAQQERKERTRNLALAGGVVVALAAIITAVVIGTSGSRTPTVPVSDVPAAAGENSLVIGPDDAPVKVVVWEDFLCPYCREFEESSRSFLHQGAVDGKVQVEYRPYQLLQDEYSAEAVNAFAAVLQNSTPSKALAFHDYAFENQPYESGGDKPGVEEMVEWAEAVGATESGVEDAIRNRDTAWLEAARTAATDAGIQGTPTVFMDGEQLQGSIQDMADQIERAISDAG
ncbi:thioredoxin domain-containing protein [Alteromonas gracilis]